MNTTGTVTHQSKNPKAKKSMAGGPITCMPMQKNKSRAPRKRTMVNKGNPTRASGPIRIPPTRHGFYPLHGEKY